MNAVLLNWKRPSSLSKVAAAIAEWPWIDRILVWDNGGELTERFSVNSQSGSRGVFGKFPENIILSDTNICTYGRWIAAQFAAGDAFYVQDDDHIVLNPETLMEAHSRCPESIVAGLPDDALSKHFTWHRHNSPGYMDIGFGAIVPKAALAGIGRYLDEYGEDELLRRKADKVVTGLWGRFETVQIHLDRLGGTGKDEHALYKRPDHNSLTQTVMRRIDYLRRNR